MNPSIEIEVGGDGRLKAAASGAVSVGARVDVRVSGLDAAGVPAWGEQDGFSGKCLRLRVVDRMGRDLARFPLAAEDAWEEDGDALTCEAELDTDALRRAMCGLPFDARREFGLVLDSPADAALYGVGKVSLLNWPRASSDDPAVVPDWRDALARIEAGLAGIAEKAEAAGASASAAAASADAAAADRGVAKANADAAAASANASSVSASGAASSASAAAASASGASSSASAAAASASSAAASASSAAAETSRLKGLFSSAFGGMSAPSASLSSLKKFAAALLAALKGIGK